MPKIIQAAVTKLINNELLVKYHKIAKSSFNSTTSIDPYKFHRQNKRRLSLIAKL